MSYEYAIEFHNVTKAYGELQAIDNLNLSIKKGIIFGLVGASGAGKSTLLRTINKLEDIQSGEIIVQGNDITNLRGKELRYYRQKVGMIFQHFSLLDSRNVFNNIALPLECNGFKKDEIARRVNELAEVVGLSDKLQNKTSELSGGQKQRVAIAGILAMSPSIIILDESTSMLDPRGKQEINDLVREISNDRQMTIISITHDIEEAKNADKIIMLNNGEIVATGTPDQLLRQTELLEQLKLDVPFALKLSKLLKAQGIKIEETLSIEELEKQLCQLHAKV